MNLLRTAGVEESLSARRAWIEIWLLGLLRAFVSVALRKESVDRNLCYHYSFKLFKRSLSARRAWIEIVTLSRFGTLKQSLSARRAWIEMVTVSL